MWYAAGGYPSPAGASPAKPLAVVSSPGHSLRIRRFDRGMRAVRQRHREGLGRSGQSVDGLVQEFSSAPRS
ncbi:hypothetical protein GCM10010504_69150 [Streptomyces griseus]|nr:hypothetical protein GCM10010504_69150 [Streptomyces griseus]